MSDRARLTPALQNAAPEAQRPAVLPVSVIIPAYNRRDLIARAIRSAFEQGAVRPAEVIVVDDASTDDTGEVAARAGAEVIRHEVNMGEGASRNTAIAHARQPWVALLDSDDEWLPNFLSLLWGARGDHVLVGGAYLRCHGTDARDYEYAGPVTSNGMVVLQPADLVFPENCIGASATMVQREVVLAAGGFDPTLKGGADLDLWIRVLERGTGLVLDQPVMRYHVHEGQVTRDRALVRAHYRSALLRYADRPWWDPAKFEAWDAGTQYDEMKALLRRGRFARAAVKARSILSSRRRVTGVARLLLHRRRLRRRKSRTDAWGRPPAGRFAQIAGVRQTEP